jgi:hypothetical protein
MATLSAVDSAVDPLRAQLTEAFDAGSFPVRRPADLLSLMANGPSVFVVDDHEMAALELALACGETLEFPYERPEDLVDDVVAARVDRRRRRRDDSL